MKINWSSIEPVRDETTLLRNDLPAQSAIVKLAEQQAEIDRLREENARYKLIYAKYVEATDRMNGAPCEQIRHQQEVDALREENARLREALSYYAEEDYNGHNGSGACARAAIREGGDKDD